MNMPLQLLHTLPRLARAAPPPQRTLEELFIKGPVANPRDNPEYAQVGWQPGAGGTGAGLAAAPCA